MHAPSARTLRGSTPNLHIGGDRRTRPPYTKEIAMSLGTILLIVLVLMLIGVLPTWPHSSGWGYGPSGGLGLVVVILLVLLVMGRL
jgi:hypothetical protein